MSATERAHTAGTYHDKLIVEQENERLRARVKELEAHLLPFARFAEMFDAMPLSQLDNTIYAIHTGTEWEAEIRLSDMRAASATLHKRLGIESPDGRNPSLTWNTRPIEDALRAENERLRAENASLKDANNIDLGEKAPLIFENTELRAKVSELTRLLAEAEDALREAADETGGEPEFSDERCSYETIQVSHGWRKEWRESAPVQRALKGASS